MEARASISPEIVGRYAIYHRIAGGGMATIHLGRLMGEAGFARTVAIKRLHPQFAQEPGFVAMFLDEARVVSRIRHPNVVPTLDVVARQDELFLVMEYVEGESLKQLLSAATSLGERPPVEVLAGIMAGVLQGLHAAHEATSEQGEPLGIVHRDVSPQNVLVGADGIARVLDFGVAKALGQLHATRDGVLMGKVAYMAPEQIAAAKVSRRTDVFAASVVLWEALAMRRLFRAENEAGTIHMILDAPAPPLAEARPDLPPSLAAVVMRGLERDPEKRHASALEMAEALEAAVALATPRVVGTWVRRLSGERMSARVALLAEIERASSRSSPDPVMRPVVAPEDPAFLREPGSQVSSVSVTKPSFRPRGATGWRRRALYGAGGSAVVLAVVLAAASAHKPGAQPPAAAASASEVVAAPAPPEESASAESASTELPPVEMPEAGAARPRHAPSRANPAWHPAPAKSIYSRD